MDPPNVLWLAGAYATALGSYAPAPDAARHAKERLDPPRGNCVSPGVRRRVARPPAQSILVGTWGLAALAVAMVPAVCIGFLRLIGVWPSDFPLTDINGSAVAVLAIGLSIFVLGMLLRRYGEAWGERFVRRPPPNIAASP